MSKKSKKTDNTQQLSFFDLEQNNQTDVDHLEDYDEEFEASFDFELDNLSDESLGLDGNDSSRIVEEHRELLTLKLLRKAIKTKNVDDPVMFDFAEYVLPNLLKLTIGVTAKGGKFFDAIDARRLAEGKEKVRRDNAGDQSLCTHLLNGLFPANLIKKRLQQLDTTVKRVIKELERRIAIASFILHDFEKFKYEWFTMMPEKYHHQNIRQLSLEDHREIIKIMVPQLGLDTFLFPTNPEQWIKYLDDILYIAYNTQRRNDTNLNLSEDGLNPVLDDRKLDCLADLACLADRLASIVKHPQDAENKSLQDILYKLSDGQLKFIYHSIAENRGVLTNIVNNAVMEAYQEVDHLPLLYLPTGVIYLSNANNQISLDTDSLPERVIKGIKELCRGELRRKQTGFGRDGKGMKYADYYSQFFDDLGLMQVALDATLRILRIGKSSVAKSRSEKLMEFQTKGILSKDDNFQFEDDLRIDQLAEFGDVVTRKIWGDRREKIELVRKQNKDKKFPALPDLNLVLEVAQFWQLESYIPQIRQIQRINETLKEHKLKGNTGGVPLDWYYLAAKYLEHHPGLENIREVGEELIRFIASKIESTITQYDIPDGWDDLRQWVRLVVMLPQHINPQNSLEQSQIFLKELDSYNHAKKDGRGRQLICSLSNSAYTVTEQMESAVLFTPQVYTNKQRLNGSNAKRNISSIAGTEMMLRQILMNQTQTVGKRFEDGKYRYLYFYPTYYFTPETNNFLQQAYTQISQTRFDTSIRGHFISKELKADFSRDRYQTIDAFIINENLHTQTQLPTDDPNHKTDRTFKLS